MKKMSVSFVLGKASKAHGGNIEHNNREFIADNIDPTKIDDNIIYVKQDIRQAYDELFSDSVAEYNSKQNRNDRKYNDYYEHIKNGNREESFYEIVVQFGDSKYANVGSELGEVATKMLDEYMRNFQKRNKNLHVFNSVLHLDEKSPHIHIDVIPFYTKGRKNGLSKGVSMKAALDEQGFIAKNAKENRLVEWENSERVVMETILKRHGFSRDVKENSRTHQIVNKYKEIQDLQKLSEHFNKNKTSTEHAEINYRAIKLENDLLKNEKEKLTAERKSPWKSFYYSDSAKHLFVQSELAKMGIPFRETDSGFEAQEVYVEQIRKIEKQFKSVTNPHRDKLRDDIDKFILQSKNYDELLLRLKNTGYEIKQGKYLAVKPMLGNQFIRVKSLGEDYSELALQNRFTHKQNFESSINAKINSTQNKTPDSIIVMGYKTVRHYTIIFSQGFLTMRKINKKKPFTWTNDAELDKLAELNKKINAGLTLDKARSEFAALENLIASKEQKIADLKSELKTFYDLQSKAVLCFENNTPSTERKSALQDLTERRINAENYYKIKEQLILPNEKEIAEITKSLNADRAKIKETATTLEALERVAGGTYVQMLVEEERKRRQGQSVNGIEVKPAK